MSEAATPNRRILPHSSTPVQTIGHSLDALQFHNAAQNHSSVLTCPTKAMDSLAQIVCQKDDCPEYSLLVVTTGLPTVSYFYMKWDTIQGFASLYYDFTTPEDAEIH